MSLKKIVLGSDHAGFEYKNILKDYLISKGYEIDDVGTYSTESCDYPIIAKNVGNKVANGEFDNGILICGTGVGMSIAANKIKGVRASVCGDTFTAKATKAHNNSNVLCLGSRVIGIGLMFDIVDIWLATEFEAGRHQRRVDLIE